MWRGFWGLVAKVDADTSVYDDGPLSVMLVVSYEGVLPEKVTRALP